MSSSTTEARAALVKKVESLEQTIQYSLNAAKYIFEHDEFDDHFKEKLIDSMNEMVDGLARLHGVFQDSLNELTMRLD